jgi:cytochrome c oxidase subunit 1
MGIAALFGIFAATFYWFPLMFGRLMNERWGKVHFYLTFAGAYALFLPMHFAGFAGNPRRYSDFTTFDFLASIMPLHRWLTGAAFFLANVQAIFLWNLFHSVWKGEKAPPNPWASTSLEWSTTEGEVVRGPYEFDSTPDAALLMQNEPVRERY